MRQARTTKRSRNSLRDISDLMTSDFDFQSMPNSARGAAEEITPRAEPLGERASASTSRQNYAFGINPIALPGVIEQDKAMQEERRRRRQKTPPPPLDNPPQAQAPIRRVRGKTPPNYF